MRKDIEIDGKIVPFRASGATPRIYRNKFNRDVFADMSAMQVDVNGEGILGPDTLATFENIAYVMAYQAALQDGTPFTSDPDEWLDQFDMMSIYDVLPQLLDLWTNNNKTLVESKKK